jgi:hypothetical protein
MFRPSNAAYAVPPGTVRKAGTASGVIHFRLHMVVRRRELSSCSRGGCNGGFGRPEWGLEGAKSVPL